MSATFFQNGLYISLGICALGTLLRVFSWFTKPTGSQAQSITGAQRITAFVKSFVKTLGSPRVFLIFKVILLDVMLQSRILKTDFLRWLMHVLIFFGFTLLTLMHALDEIVTQKLFPDYASTLNPFFFLRNLFALMVLVGIGIAIYRRLKLKGPFLRSKSSDKIAIYIIAGILLTGFALDSAKIVSEPAFDRMLEEYYSEGDEEEFDALRVYWAKEYGVVFASLPESSDELMEMGEELNGEVCLQCHSKPNAAFLAYPLAKAIKPFAGPLNRSRADEWIYFAHVILCFIGLAYLPFSKFFHIITDPLTMIVNGISDKRKQFSPASGMNRRALELDACTNCGTCAKYCSVAPFYRLLGNEAILPAQKVDAVKRLSRGTPLTNQELEQFSEGAFICTSCYRCTTVCPTAINLQDQWDAQRACLTEKGFPMPQVWIKERNASQWAETIQLPKTRGTGAKYTSSSTKSHSFDACIQCQTCTNVCPVVECNVDKDNSVDITPQKVMNLLRMGMRDTAMGTRMVWDCATCYQCQENCPQGIHVTDIMYELKNIAYEQFSKTRHEQENK